MVINSHQNIYIYIDGNFVGPVVHKPNFTQARKLETMTLKFITNCQIHLIAIATLVFKNWKAIEFLEAREIGRYRH